MGKFLIFETKTRLRRDFLTHFSAVSRQRRESRQTLVFVACFEYVYTRPLQATDGGGGGIMHYHYL